MNALTLRTRERERERGNRKYYVFFIMGTGVPYTMARLLADFLVNLIYVFLLIDARK